MENEKPLLKCRALLCFFLFLSCLTVLAEEKLSTPKSVEDFYQGMKSLANIANNPNQEYRIIDTMNKSFFARKESSSGGNLYNDFRFFDYDKNQVTHKHDSLSSATYINRLEKYLCVDKVMKVDYRIIKTELYGKRIDYQDKKMSSSSTIMATYIEKTYNINGQSKLFMDTVLTDYSSGKINVIRNGYGKPSVDVASLKIQAERAYFREHFVEAYKCYEKIIALNPNDADACYRLALLTYYKYNKCKIERKGHKEKAISLLESAIQSARKEKDWGFCTKLGNVLDHWKYDGSIF